MMHQEDERRSSPAVLCTAQGEELAEQRRLLASSLEDFEEEDLDVNAFGDVEDGVEDSDELV